MIGDARELHLQPPATVTSIDPKLDALLTLADECQQLWLGSFVELIVHIPAEDHPWRDGAEITDNHRLYSVKLAKR